MAKAILEEIEFKNDLGQTIKPGDEVVIVTTGYSHSVSTNKGTYVGMVNGGASIVKQVKTSYYSFKSNGERVPYSWFNKMYAEQNEMIARKRAEDRQYRYWADPEYKEIQEKRYALIETKYEIVPRKTTLKLNRAYKLAA
jgi:hypothetical protein